MTSDLMDSEIFLLTGLVFQDCHTKCHKLSELQQQNFIISQFWRPEVQDQLSARTLAPLKVLQKDLFQAFLLVSGASLSWASITVSTWHSPCAHVSVPDFPLFIRKPGIWDQGPALLQCDFYLNQLLHKNPISK